MLYDLLRLRPVPQHGVVKNSTGTCNEPNKVMIRLETLQEQIIFWKTTAVLLPPTELVCEILNKHFSLMFSTNVHQS